jgi:hypothetical protein
MPLLVEIGAAVLVGGAGATGATVGVVVHRLRRANRVAPDRRSPAPTTWLWSFRRSALLHRRLRGVCEMAVQASVPASGPTPRRPWRRQPDVPSPLERVAADLIERAVAVDDQLVAADRLAGRWRRAALSRIESEIRELELAASRLAALSATLRRQLEHAGALPPTADIGHQLDAVEAALAELRAPGT